MGKPSTKSTWVSASSVPSQLIREYEGGLQREIVNEKFTSAGQTIHTLSSTALLSAVSPPKRVRVDMPTSDNTG